MQIQFRQENSALYCVGGLDIGNADEFRKVLIDALNQNPELLVDLSAVTSCDAAALQLCYAAEKHAENQGKGFRVASMSDAVREAAKALGLPPEALLTGVARV